MKDPNISTLWSDEIQQPTLYTRLMDGNTWYDAYRLGYRPARYPVPAIPLRVVWPDPMNWIGYKDMIYIDDIADPDDPVMVCAWDFYDGPNHIGKRGEYTRT